MFKCDQCLAVFRRKDSLIRHKKNHDGVRFSCTICTSTFSYKSGCVRHMKNVHSVAHAQSLIRRVEIATAPRVPDTSINHRQPSHGEIEIAPQIFVPDIPAGRSNTHQSVQNNVTAPHVPDTSINNRQPSHEEIEIAPQIFVPDIPTGRSSTHQSVQNNFTFGEENEQWGDDTSDALCAEVLDIVENAGLCENQDSFMRNVGSKRRHVGGNASCVKVKRVRMNMIKGLGFKEIKSAFNRKIVWYYAKNSGNIRTYKLFFDTLKSEHSFTALLNEEEVYLGKGSGYVFQCIDGLLLTVYKYTPTGDILDIRLPIIRDDNDEDYNNNNNGGGDNIDNDNNGGGDNIDNNGDGDNIDNDNNGGGDNIDNDNNGGGDNIDNNNDNNRGGDDIDNNGGTANDEDNNEDYNYNDVINNFATGGSSYIKLPTYIEKKRATINPQNSDQKCFKWSILAKHVTGSNKHRVGNNYYRHENKYNFEGLSYPTPWDEIKIFEKNNNVSINLYGIKKIDQSTPKCKNYHIFPLKVVDDEKTDHFDMILFNDGEKSHYVYISNFSRLIRSQSTLHGHAVYFCKRCFTSFDQQNLKYKLNGQLALEQHRLICGSQKPILAKMPDIGTTLQFKSWENANRHPFTIYADFEALLFKTNENKGTNSKIIQHHKPMSYGFVVKVSDDVPLDLVNAFNIPTSPVIHRGNIGEQDVAKHFVESIVEVSRKIEQLLKTNVPITMSDDDTRRHNANTHCNFCKQSFNSVEKVRDHCHLSGKFRQSLCYKCNITLQQPKFVPCFFHNLSSYDAHFIVTELGYDAKSIDVIPNTEEKYISFSKYISNTFTIRFVDTFKFMASSLSSLANNLMTTGYDKFRETAKHFSTVDMTLVTRKGVYPYEYTDGWEKLDTVTLPEKEDFYSTLTESEVNDEEYEHAKNVWNHFGCQTLGEYSDLYLKIDILLLSDVFENFRDLCLKTYNLDPAFYYTAPGFSFDCMLKHTSIKLELLSDYDMLLMIENGIRGGLVQASKRYAKANNEETLNYDAAEEKSWIVYQDCNNLYGWAMSEYIPYGGFKYVKPSLEGINDLADTSPIGRIYDVDISYPQNLHDEHNDLPFLPQNSIPKGSKMNKLMATFKTKKNYIVHYRSLQQAIANGLIVEKVNRVLQFNQSAWLADYINLNTEMRKKALNDFEKGKTMEQVRRRIKMKLVSSENRIQKLINLTTFKYATAYNETLSAVSLENKVITFDKPIYIGLAVLDISKTLMYDYHYNVIRKQYGNKANLMYTDTDSLVYHIMTDNFYNDLVNNPILLDRMDTSNLPTTHPYYIAERRKIPGFFSDETDGLIITEFCALRAKSYAYKINGEEKIKAKGIRGHVVKNHMSFDHHRQCLFGELDFETCRQQNVSIRSFRHQLVTLTTNKMTYNCFDDKRVMLEDNIHTYAHGHYKIQEIEELERIEAELVAMMDDAGY
ncbi:hypothetical protein AGLY_018262 [Aphis glycines]|uniref:C2H2-type domain-containing protein n=1 Tax=Aphis glycines TaxID=307491 RepID=A0A6G0SSH4_APHGL|nr:hypothetical protein AGLY_018262 [Aphis glycines]